MDNPLLNAITGMTEGSLDGFGGRLGDAEMKLNAMDNGLIPEDPALRRQLEDYIKGSMNMEEPRRLDAPDYSLPEYYSPMYVNPTDPTDYYSEAEVKAIADAESKLSRGLITEEQYQQFKRDLLAGNAEEMVRSGNSFGEEAIARGAGQPSEQDSIPGELSTNRQWNAPDGENLSTQDSIPGFGSDSSMVGSGETTPEYVPPSNPSPQPSASSPSSGSSLTPEEQMFLESFLGKPGDPTAVPMQGGVDRATGSSATYPVSESGSPLLPPPPPEESIPDYGMENTSPSGLFGGAPLPTLDESGMFSGPLYGEGGAPLVQYSEPSAYGTGSRFYSPDYPVDESGRPLAPPDGMSYSYDQNYFPGFDKMVTTPEGESIIRIRTPDGTNPEEAKQDILDRMYPPTSEPYGGLDVPDDINSRWDEYNSSSSTFDPSLYEPTAYYGPTPEEMLNGGSDSSMVSSGGTTPEMTGILEPTPIPGYEQPEYAPSTPGMTPTPIPGYDQPSYAPPTPGMAPTPIDGYEQPPYAPETPGLAPRSIPQFEYPPYAPEVPGVYDQSYQFPEWTPPQQEPPMPPEGEVPTPSIPYEEPPMPPDGPVPQQYEPSYEPYQEPQQPTPEDLETLRRLLASAGAYETPMDSFASSPQTGGAYGIENIQSLLPDYSQVETAGYYPVESYGSPSGAGMFYDSYYPSGEELQRPSFEPVADSFVQSLDKSNYEPSYQEPSGQPIADSFVENVEQPQYTQQSYQGPVADSFVENVEPPQYVQQSYESPVADSFVESVEQPQYTQQTYQSPVADSFYESTEQPSWTQQYQEQPVADSFYENTEQPSWTQQYQEQPYADSFYENTEQPSWTQQTSSSGGGNWGYGGDEFLGGDGNYDFTFGAAGSFADSPFGESDGGEYGYDYSEYRKPKPASTTTQNPLAQALSSYSSV